MHIREKSVKRIDFEVIISMRAEKPREKRIPYIAFEKKDFLIIKSGHYFSAV